MPERQINLTSAEIASIWTSYMNDSMAKCILGYFLEHVEDEEIRSIVQFSYDLSSAHIDKLTTIFQEEQIPTPTGFTYDDDVNFNAPRMYTDSFKLTYINHMAKVGLLANSGFISMSARNDIRTFFIESIHETTELFARSSNVAISKGTFIRAPYIPYPTETDYIDTKKYLSGLSPFNKHRPLNAIEISHLFLNIQTNLIGSKLATSFAQATSRNNIRKWMLRGRDISQKHIEIFTKILLNNDIIAPMPSDICITDSTTAPFSDKLIMFHMSLLNATGTGNYATAAAVSQRSDLTLNYERLSLEVAQYTKDGADILIDNAWLEQTPGTTDKDQLTKKKDTSS
ncbi:DUF3231 family protein [Bacillus sp. FJAT-45037]|uniref:DUF3231 family protein n=1 Tax=Bacillus sp. FJAT-45037 TaxID=2011007 RepID=UPI000C234339|nr:DUF3231 family protein [Bacillus sp. FJAT-45037]